MKVMLRSGAGLGLALLVAVAAPSAHAADAAIELRPATAATIHEAIESAGGKAILLNVWSTWCEPCKREMPDLVRLRQKYGAQGFRLILVSTDPPTGKRAAERFLRKVRVTFPTWIKRQPDAAFIDGIDREWSGAQPLNILYDAEGQRRELWEGEVEISELERAIETLLGS